MEKWKQSHIKRCFSFGLCHETKYFQQALLNLISITTLRRYAAIRAYLKLFFKKKFAFLQDFTLNLHSLALFFMKSKYIRNGRKMVKVL